MLGPLPFLYKVVVATCVLLAFVGTGAWVALALSLPLPVSGAGIGAACGLLVAALLLHRSPHASGQAVGRASRR